MEDRQHQDLQQDLATLTDQQLVERYNLDVAKENWRSAQIDYPAIMLREFDRRGLDTSAISDGDTLTYQTRVVIQDGKIIPAADAGA